MRVRTLLFLSLVLSAGLIAAGCGGDDSSGDGGLSDDEQSSLISGCQEAIDNQSALSAEQGDELVSKCEEVAESAGSLDEASQAICEETAKVVGGDAVSDKQAAEGCASSLPASDDS